MFLSTGFPLGFSKYMQARFQVGSYKMSELVRSCKILLILVSSALRDEPRPTVMLLPLLRADYSSGAGIPVQCMNDHVPHRHMKADA